MGVFLLSVPAWAFEAASQPTWTAILGGGGGVLMGFGLGAIVNEQLDPTHAAVQEAINLHADPSVEGNLRSAIRDEVSLALAEVASSSVDFGPRATLFDRLKFEQLSNEVVIQSISLSSKWQIAQLLERLLLDNTEASAKILLVHPYSVQAGMRDIDLTFTNGTIRQLVAETMVPLSSVATKLQNDGRLEVRGYFSIPYYGIICTDRRRLLLSLSRESRGGDQNLGAFIEAGSQGATAFVDDLLRGFDDRWQSAKDLLAKVEISFLPGSERINAERIEFVVQADKPLDLASFVFESLTSTQLRAHANPGVPGQYVLSALPISTARQQRFQILEALAAADDGWLRDPVEIALPSYDALASGSSSTNS